MMQTNRSLPSRRVWIALIAAFAVGFAARGCWSGGAPDHAPPSTDDAGAETETATEWTCSMHPQIRQPNPGLCPICNMELIPVSEGDDDAAEPSPRRLSTSRDSVALLQIETAPVVRRPVEVRLRMTGKVDYDETRVGRIAAWVPGRIERMYADYTGVRVRKGDPMVDLYSPELLTAKDELLRASRALRSMPSGGPGALRDAAEGALEAVRRKLARWGLTEEQIALAEREGVMSDRITIHAPAGGTVTERTGREGMYVDTGEIIYTIADLSEVWVQLEAFEDDLPWVRLDQPVTFTAEAFPGETFEGRIAFIAPVLDDRTRTVRVRVATPNPDGRLKPGMLVRAELRARVGADGDDPPLAVPASAVLRTGRRAVVYVQAPDADRPTYDGREITLGPRAGDVFVVASGLEAGERVVTRGAFKLDSELQIQARPSMMSPPEPEGDAMEMTDAPEAFRGSLREMVAAYLPVQDALAHDEPDAAAEAASALAQAVADAPVDALEGEAIANWKRGVGRELAESVERFIAAGTDIDAQRMAFQAVSDALIAAIRRFGAGDGDPIYRHHCPMAFDFAGADWIQTDEEIRNPYFGAAMFSCGTVEERLDAPASHGEGAHDH